MNKYLNEILQIQSSVILPGLGALMVPSQKSGKIVFNPHLKFNDGSLAKYITDKEGIDEQEAQNKVAKFVREIEAELGKGNTYNMFEFGEFFKNKDGEVDFKMAKKAGIEPQPIKEKPTASQAPKKTETKKTVEKPKETIEKKKEESALETNEKPAEKKGTEIEVDKLTSKQTKNTFTPPVEKVVEKTKDVAKETSKKVEEAKDKIVEKATEIKKEVVNKKKEITTEKKEKQDHSKKTLGAIISGKAEKDFEDDKQNKNTFIPPKKEETKKFAPVKSDNDEKKDGATSIAASASANKETTTTKNTTKETVVAAKEEKKKSRLPLIILLLLLIGLAVAGYFFRHEIMHFFGIGENHTEMNEGDDHGEGQDHNDGDRSTTENTHDEMVDETVMENDSTDQMTEDTGDNNEIVEDKTDEPEVTPEEVVVEETTPVVQDSNSGNYHLIGNSFEEKANAERYVKTMETKGYPAKVLGRFDGLYLVSIRSFDSRQAAQNGRSNVVSDASSAWIFKY